MSGKNIIINSADAEKLLGEGDGLAALLYLHIRSVDEYSLSAAARELRRSETEIAAAAALLRKLGLLKTEKPLEKTELPEYSAADVVRRAEQDELFDGLVDSVQRALGKFLSVADMRSLYGIYDYLGIPAEVILLLVTHCIEVYRENHGEGRMPTMRHIEKEAWYWAEREIISLEAAEEHIRFEKERKTLLFRSAEVLQIRGRDLSPTEKRYIESWLELGFVPESLAVAYDRTVIGTGKLAWRYMDKIVRSWHEKGLHSLEEVTAGDPRLSRKPAPASSQSTGEADRELEELRRLHAHLKGKES